MFGLRGGQTEGHVWQLIGMSFLLEMRQKCVSGIIMELQTKIAGCHTYVQLNTSEGKYWNTSVLAKSSGRAQKIWRKDLHPARASNRQLAKHKPAWFVAQNRTGSCERGTRANTRHRN